MLKDWIKIPINGIIILANLIALAQFRVWYYQKGIRLQENLTVLSNQAAKASPERAEKKPHVAIAKDVKRWQNYKNHSQWGNSLNSWKSILKRSINGFIKDGLK